MENAHRDALGYPNRRLPDPIRDKIRIPFRGLNFRVPEQPPDHWKTLPERQSARRKTVAAVMDTNVLETGETANTSPRLIDIAHQPPRADLRIPEPFTNRLLFQLC